MSTMLRSGLRLANTSFRARGLLFTSQTFGRIQRYSSATTTQNPDEHSPLISHLRDRGLVASLTNESLQNVIDTEKITVYCGADPSAISLHVGNLIPLIILLHFYIRGHNVIGLVGGATGEVGDPSGRSTERQQMESDVRSNNVTHIRSQLETFLSRGKEYADKRGYKGFGTARTQNNADWWRDVKMLNFLSNYGRHIRVGQMLARESVKNRMESEQGIGFNEFTYQILQAFDFWHLHSNEGCRLQVGGNDQWGNITAGTDLISRLRSEAAKNKTLGKLPKASKDQDAAYGMTVPLLTTPSGEKFGKSAGNAVWIDPSLTKPYELYQYFIRAPDSVVETYLKMFTLIPLESINEIMAQHVKDESARNAQKVLAEEVTDLIHGLGTGKRAKIMSSIMFSNSSSEPLSGDDILAVFKAEGLLQTLQKDQVVAAPWRDVISQMTSKSKSEISRLIKGGGVYHGLNRSQVQNGNINQEDLVDGKLLLIRVGKSAYHVAEVV